MKDGLITQWPMLLYFLSAWLYFELIRRLDHYWANRTPLSDEERLSNLARSQGISEHEVFKRAAVKWSLNPDKANTDFNSYLKSDILPHYVRDYLRKR